MFVAICTNILVGLWNALEAFGLARASLVARNALGFLMCNLLVQPMACAWTKPVFTEIPDRRRKRVEVSLQKLPSRFHFRLFSSARQVASRNQHLI